MKKQLKFLLVGLIAITMLFSVAGCGSENTAGESTNEENVENVENVEATDGSLDRVKDTGVLNVGCEGNWYPYIYNDPETNELVGFEVEVAKEIADRLGVEVEYHVSNKWDGVLAGLDAKRYDTVICGVTPLPDRLEKYGATTYYNEDPVVLVVNENNEDIKSFEDIEGKMTGNALSSSSGEIARKYGAELRAASLTEAMDLLSNDRIDCYINSQVSINEYLKEKPDTPVKIVAKYEPEHDYETAVSALLRKDDVDLLNEMNGAIEEMLEDGTLYNLAVKYFGQEVADNISLHK